MMKVGIIGLGYWGPNIIRNFSSIPNVQVALVSDLSGAARERSARNFPFAPVTADPMEVLRSKEIDIVAIVTPVFTHFELAKAALENGKHVFVEKPFTATSAQAEELIELATRKNLQIMVDHTFIFTGAVKKIKELIDAKTLGGLYYYDSTRVNLGLLQQDVNVVWDLAPHDYSIMDYLLADAPTEIAAHGKDHFGTGREDVAYVTLHFQNNFIAHFNFNWISPVKIRKTLIGGEHKMLLWDDLENDEKIRVYDKGVSLNSTESAHNLRIQYRAGDMVSPRVDYQEALKVEAQYFIDCINKSESPMNDGISGLRVVKLLETTSRSMKQHGASVPVR